MRRLRQIIMTGLSAMIMGIIPLAIPVATQAATTPTANWAVEVNGGVTGRNAEKYPTQLTWNVGFNAIGQKLGNVSLVNTLSAGQAYVPGSVVATTGTFNPDGTFSSATGHELTPTVTLNGNITLGQQVTFAFKNVTTPVTVYYQAIPTVSGYTGNWQDTAEVAGHANANQVTWNGLTDDNPITTNSSNTAGSTSSTTNSSSSQATTGQSTTSSTATSHANSTVTTGGHATDGSGTTDTEDDSSSSVVSNSSSSHATDGAGTNDTDNDSSSNAVDSSSSSHATDGAGTNDTDSDSSSNAVDSSSSSHATDGAGTGTDSDSSSNVVDSSSSSHPTDDSSVDSEESSSQSSDSSMASSSSSASVSSSVTLPSSSSSSSANQSATTPSVTVPGEASSSSSTANTNSSAVTSQPGMSSSSVMPGSTVGQSTTSGQNITVPVNSASSTPNPLLTGGMAATTTPTVNGTSANGTSELPQAETQPVMAGTQPTTTMPATLASESAVNAALPVTATGAQRLPQTNEQADYAGVIFGGLMLIGLGLAFISRKQP
ncbi:LPXTG cell wall anchor domain-containing protein [Levilactobacillus acidifarinae]|nr:LPXTG cell wall anchor domain-containing protein [Levilactobacillus acidifarinae]GEO70072.1 hypothetical protein LAC03_19820 [Levilactobacillus acidifarinae]